MPHDILIIDDEPDIRDLVEAILQDEGYQTRAAGDSDAALAAVRARRPSLALVDIWLHGSPLDGIEILKAVKRDHPQMPVLMISGHGTIETAVEAIKHGAYDFIEKPFKTDRLLLLIERAIEAAELRRENEELRSRAGNGAELIGTSSAIGQLRAAIERVAPTGSRVLISGAPGTGKEVAARLLHARSRRHRGPFVAINCANMSPDRIEGELFGHESSAEGATTGLFEQAHGGTLLLDEVADMPLVTQGKIVRALQDQSFLRIGGATRVEVDVRVIASTNRDLQAEIGAGRFREDLFYRLNVVPLRVPALREHREDIPDLLDFFGTRYAATAGLPLRQLGEDATAALQGYDWPGNVRQLKNVVERLLILAPGHAKEPIRADMLPPEVTESAPPVLHWDKGSEIMTLPLRDAREVFEREYLLAQVTRFGGNISRTASFIGMERSALHRKLKSLGLSSPSERAQKVEP